MSKQICEICGREDMPLGRVVDYTCFRLYEGDLVCMDCCVNCPAEFICEASPWYIPGPKELPNDR